MNVIAKATCSEAAPSPSLFSRIHGCWLGKSIGGTLGLPAEGKMQRLNFSFYDPIPTSAPPNDDLELQLVWLHLVENSGPALSQTDFANAWIAHIHYMWDEYGRTRWNLRRGVPVENVGTFENPFHAGMGSPIRSEFWACLFPGDLDSAAHYAALDASLDHGLEGIAGEVFFATMQSAVAGGSEIGDAIKSALKYLPLDCETGRAILMILESSNEGLAEWDCWKKLVAQYGNENFTYAPLNVALTIWALWYGGGNFERSILLAANGGYDTDCTAATVGATIGFILGKDGIPNRWIEPIGEDVAVGPGIIGILAPKTLTELSDRTMALIGKLERKSWDGCFWEMSPPPIELGGLLGTIQIMPFEGERTIAWANGELPSEIKQAGGGSWAWQITNGEPKIVICLAREGARLFINDHIAVDCPKGVAYVAATHRSATGSRVLVMFGPGTYNMRVELNSNAADQDASVILASADLHIASWTNENMPHAPQLMPTPLISLM